MRRRQIALLGKNGDKSDSLEKFVPSRLCWEGAEMDIWRQAIDMALTPATLK